MAAAVELARRDVPVTVFEAGRVLGGRARRVELDGKSLDNGLHILLGAYRETLRLIDIVRGPDEPDGLLRLPLELTLHPHFAMKAPQLPAPLHLLGALLGARGLGWGDRIAAARLMTWARRNRFRLASDTTVKALLAEKKQPAAVTRFLWRPLCISALNTLPEEASAQVFLNVLRDGLDARRSDSDMLLPTMDFSSLFPERAARYVRERGGEVRLVTSIDTIRRTGEHFEVAHGEYFTQTILALSPHRVAALLEPHAVLLPIAKMIGDLRYQPIYSVYLQYAPQVQLPFAMGGLEATYSQWLFDRGRLCGQHGLIGIVISSSGAHQNLPHDALAQVVHEELAANFRNLGDPLSHRVIAEKRATFACTPGLARPDNVTPVPRLFLAGDYTASDYPATIESAVRSGVRAAKLVMQNA